MQLRRIFICLFCCTLRFVAYNRISMKQKVTVKFKPDPEGFFASASLGGVDHFAFGTNELAAQVALVRKLKFFLNPTEAPTPKEIEI